MSCIDAAIIKKLVDHIASDSDNDTPVGGGSSDVFELERQPGSIECEEYVEDPDSGSTRKIYKIVGNYPGFGDIIRMVRIVDDEVKYTDYMLIHIKQSGQRYQFVSIDSAFNERIFVYKDGRIMLYSDDLTEYDAMMNNPNVGIFRFKNPTLVGLIKMWITIFKLAHPDSVAM
jgi:hypothetical protein